MAGFLVGLPSNNIAPEATPSWAVSSADASYPVTNVLTLEPGDVAKAIATTATLRLTWGGSKTPEIVGLIHTNLGGASSVTVATNGGMVAVTMSIHDSEDGLCQCGWVDLRGLTGVAGTQLNIAVTGATGNVAIGTVVVLDDVYEPKVRWRYRLGQRMPKIRHETAADTEFIYAVPSRRRSVRCEAHWAEDRPFWRSLQLEAYSVTPTPFLVIPDEEDIHALLAQFDDESFSELYEFFDGSFASSTQTGLVETPFEVREVGAGAPL